MPKSPTKPKNCFIIMPISTREDLLPMYGGDPDHFSHVLKCLIIPAIERAGLRPVPPKSVGSKLIHGDIIDKIKSSDCLLCDMSTLNANVFFELGIRTAVNRNICLILDDITKEIPFDLNLINHHKYSSSMKAWELEKEIEDLKEHIGKSSSSEHNDIWKYLSINSALSSEPASITTDDKSNYLIKLVESLRDDFNNHIQASSKYPFTDAYIGSGVGSGIQDTTCNNNYKAIQKSVTELFTRIKMPLSEALGAASHPGGPPGKKDSG